MYGAMANRSQVVHLEEVIKTRIIGYTSTGKTYHFGSPSQENNENNIDNCQGVLYKQLERHQSELGRLVEEGGLLFPVNISYNINLNETGEGPLNEMTISIIPIKYYIPTTPFKIEIKYYDYPGQDHLLSYILLFNMMGNVFGPHNNSQEINNLKENIRKLIEKLNIIASYDANNDSDDYENLKRILKEFVDTIISGDQLINVIDRLIGYNAGNIKNIVINHIYMPGRLDPIYEDYQRILNEKAIKKIYISTFKEFKERINEFDKWNDRPSSSVSIIGRMIYLLLSIFYQEFIKYVCRNIPKAEVDSNNGNCVLDNKMSIKIRQRWARLLVAFDALSYIFEEISNLINENPNNNITITKNNINDWLKKYKNTNRYKKYVLLAEDETIISRVVDTINTMIVVVARLTVSVIFTILTILSAILESSVLFLTVPAYTDKFLMEHLGPKHGLYRNCGDQRFKDIIKRTLKPIMGGLEGDLGNINNILKDYCENILEANNNENNCNKDERKNRVDGCVELLKSSIAAISVFNYYIIKLIRNLRDEKDMPIVVVIATMLDAIKNPQERKAVLCSMTKLTDHIVRRGQGSIDRLQDLERVISKCWDGTGVKDHLLFRFIPPFLPSIRLMGERMNKPDIIIVPGGAINIRGRECINDLYAVVMYTALVAAILPGWLRVVEELERALYCEYTGEGCS